MIWLNEESRIKRILQPIKNLLIHLSHSYRRISNHISTSFRLFYRSRVTIFLLIFYPIILLLLFGALFAQYDTTFNLEIQDNDITVVSEELIQNLTAIDILEVNRLSTGVDPKEYLQENGLYACLVIPENWTLNSYNPSFSSSNVTLIIDPYSSSAQAVSNIVIKTIKNFNIQQKGYSPRVNLETENFYSDSISYIDFFLPGIIGVTIMNTGLLGTIFRQVHFKQTGLFKKFTTTPLTRWEYVIGEITWQSFIAFVATTLSVFTAWLAFDFSWGSFDELIIPIIFIGVILFSGIGLLLSQIIRNPNNVLIIGTLLTIPMIFLSGVFFDVSGLKILSILSKFSPLTFIVEALRSSMITRDFRNAWSNIGISFGIGIMAILFGIFLTRWERE